MATIETHTVMPSGGDFTTFHDAMDHIAASHHDLVGDDKIQAIKIDGTWSSADTVRPFFSTALHTDATRYLWIYTTAEARRDPTGATWDTGAYRLEVTDPTASAINIMAGNDYLFIDGLQIACLGVTAADRHIIGIGTLTSGTNNIRISNCVLKGANNDTYLQRGISTPGTNVVLDVWNTIIYNLHTAVTGTCGIYVDCASADIYSCAIIGGKYGIFRSAGTTVVKNCYVGGSGTEDYYGTLTAVNCASEDASSDDSTATNCLTSVALDTDTFVAVAGGSEDYHLAADGLSPLQGTGVDTSGDAAPMNFTTDIDGDTIVNWSIGADDGVVAAVTNIMLNII